jgi:hypothetical protein
LTEFEEFCEGWIALYNGLKKRGADDHKIGTEFEDYFLNRVLVPFVKGYRTERNRHIKGIEYTFDFLVLRKGASEYSVFVSSRRVIAFLPPDVVAALEVKSRGFFGNERIEIISHVFHNLERNFPQIKPFYVTFRERDDYERMVRNSFGENAPWYYRLADSGNGEMPPKTYFSAEWDRMIRDVKGLRNS